MRAGLILHFGSATFDQQLEHVERPFVDTVIVPMAPVGDAPDGHLRYSATLDCSRAGRVGVTVRIVPSHPLVATPVELGRIAWA